MPTKRTSSRNVSPQVLEKSQSEQRLKGVPASPGIVMGKARIIVHEAIAANAEKLPKRLWKKELKRFESAIEGCSQEIDESIQFSKLQTSAATPILEAQSLILLDFVMNEAIRARIEEGFTAESAIIQEYDAQENILKLSNDVYLRERAADIEHVKQRLLAHLRDANITHTLDSDTILVGSTLTPTEILLFSQGGMSAFVTELGGITSHMALLARSLHIPAVIGLRNLLMYVRDGDTIIVDGYSGVLIINPKPESIAKCERRAEELQAKSQKQSKIAKLPSETVDGRKIKILANIDSADDIDEAIANGAQGVGLVRTEFLCLQLRRFPTEDEQAQWYTELAERAYPLPITLRAFDIGGDKLLDTSVAEENPALGLRGIRLLMKRKDIFKAQVRAVFRASKHRNLKFMIPMISGVTELEEAREFIEKIKQEMIAEKIDLDHKMPIGVMIETPSAALLAKELAERSDFFSIGTNDLTQYTLAADRTSYLVGNIFDAFHPAVLRLIRHTAQCAGKNNIPVSVCGDIAGHSAATELLIGLGVTELSAVPSLLLEIKKRVRKISYSHSFTVVDSVLSLTSGTEIRKKISAISRR